VHGGIDEAGRGPVMGPLVVAGVACIDVQRLHDMGCRDSKILSPAKRERLHRLLRTDPAVHVAVRVLGPTELDQERNGQSLNAVEARMFAEVAAELVGHGCSHFVLDAADVDAERYGRIVAAALDGLVGAAPERRVESRHRADASDPAVAAASIVAKVTRDRAIADLARRLERRLAMPLGSGYPSDPDTRAFLLAWHERFGDVPEGARRSWATVRDLLAPAPTRLDAFL
jgi:ribonuclease HII